MSSRERERFDEIGKKIKRDGAAADCGELHYHNPPMAGRSSRSQMMMMMMMMMGPPGTLNTITPCAACKLLRRRCAQECPFSPYFSPHEPLKFASVHKVFGASNVSKMLMEVAESQRADAANSLVYEANVRLRDPVYGCMGAISALQQQIQASQAELDAVRAHIIRFKRTQSNILIPLPPPPPPPPPQHITGDILPSSAALAPLQEPPGTAVEFVDVSSENSQYFMGDHHHHHHHHV